MDWWDALGVCALFAGFLAPGAFRGARARWRLGGMRQGRRVAVPCRYWTEGGRSPYPRNPVTGHLLSGSLAFRSRWRRTVPLPHGLTGHTSNAARDREWGLMRYSAPDGSQHVFEVPAQEADALDDAIAAGQGAGLDVPVSVTRAGGPPVYRPLLAAVLAGLVLGAASALTGHPGLVVLAVFGALYAVAQAVAAAVFLVEERRAWPEAYGKRRPAAP
ncbi:hypothetical protein [Streptomyces sp. NPDC057854]|uniref:hypothetical protein n=1 Tax=unclassified Streptomyces TaxID=2593676 RepID=UPI0036A7A4FB